MNRLAEALGIDPVEIRRRNFIAPTSMPYKTRTGLEYDTGEFARVTQRRYDDTAILIAELCEWGYESERGRQSLGRINWAHGHYRISNDDFLYVLSTFIYEPVRWIDVFGWRSLCEVEREA